jgi:hypothetical protein
MPGTRDSHYYWNNTASSETEAQTLATRLGLDFPADAFNGFKSGLV